MEIGNRQEFRFSRFYPARAFESLAFWTVAVTAGVVADLEGATFHANIFVPTERSATAIQYRIEDPMDMQGQSMARTIIFAISPENIGNFVSGTTSENTRRGGMKCPHENALLLSCDYFTASIYRRAYGTNAR
jgi:hypothetical protein